MEQTSQIRVLVVDNDQTILTILEEFLALSDYEVNTAATGLDALKLLRNGDYGLLLTDIVMPDISGLGLIEIARKEFPGLPIIAMTGYSKQVKNLASEQSPDYYLEKPFNLKKLADIIESVLHK
ncbi:MAG: response regulator [Deltaproteobacteria bacterium]|nr:response regulator [Deltaproteobacteria bacterium]